jgi:hypothetical protein
VEAEIQETSHITQDTLHCGEVRLMGIVHMKENLLYDIGDVGAGERQVLEGPDEALELSQIRNRRPGSGEDLGLRVHGHQDRLVGHHASTLKDVESELTLSEEESICLMLYRDPQKMVKRAEVLHDEFPLDERYDMLQEHCARCIEHNVINIKQQVYCIDTVAEVEQGGVGLGLNKFQSEEVCGEPAVPSPGHLLHPVESLVEAADSVRLHGINKPRRLAAVDFLYESTMQERNLHIKLVDGVGM